MAIRTLRDDHTFLCKFYIFKWLYLRLLTFESIKTKLGDFVKLGLHSLAMWITFVIVANSIIYRLVPRPSRYEISQCFKVQWSLAVFTVMLSLRSLPQTSSSDQ